MLPSLNGGGAERAAVHILNALSPDRWQRSMFLFSRTGPYLDEVDPSIQLDSAAGEGRLAQWRALRAFVARTRPQVVVSFLSYFSVLTAVRAAAVGARVVFNQQTPMSAFLADGDYPWRRGWRRTRVQRGDAPRLRRGRSDRDDVTRRGRRSRRPHLVCGAATSRWCRIRSISTRFERPRANRSTRPSSAPGSAPVIVAAGRLAEAKNYPLLIDAMAVLRQSIDARLFILGTGDEEAAIRARIRERGLEYAITLCGFQKNPWKYIARADVFALSSHYEGFGNVLIEAMACGVPVVATASAGTRDIVRDGVDGILVERHQPEAFAGALASVLGDPQRRRLMAAAASESAPRFALPRIAQIYDETFQGVMA